MDVESDMKSTEADWSCCTPFLEQVLPDAEACVRLAIGRWPPNGGLEEWQACLAINRMILQPSDGFRLCLPLLMKPEQPALQINAWIQISI